MTKIYETLEKNYIKFETEKISIIIDNDDMVWFNASETATALGYIYPSEVIKKHIEKADKIQLKDINTDLDVRKHPHSIYLNESGLYSLLMRSKLPKAKKFKRWITSQVIPSIRKFGYYKLQKDHSKEVSSILKKVDELKNLKQELKKEKYPTGGVIYAIDYSTEDREIYRIGMTKDMKNRKKLYDTHSVVKRNVVLIHETTCPIKLETCLRALLYDNRVKNRKDFYECSLGLLKRALNACINSIEKCSTQKGGTKNGVLLIDECIEIYNDRVTFLQGKIEKLENKLKKGVMVKIRIS
jgi:prophage antirepressor-like protein